MANSSGGKTAIQTLREEFHPLEISELTGYANLKSISNYSHSHKKRRMSKKMAGYNASTTTNTSPSRHILREQVRRGGGGGGGRNKAWDREMMFSQLAKRSAGQRF